MRAGLTAALALVGVAGCSLDKVGIGIDTPVEDTNVAIDSTTPDTFADTTDSVSIFDTDEPVDDTGSPPGDTSMTDTADTALTETEPVDIGPETPVTGHITMSGAVLAATAAINLSMEGTAGWAHWGFADPASFVQKAGMGTIGRGGTIPGAGVAKRYTFPLKLTWNDGDPVPIANEVGHGIYVEKKDHGFFFDAAGGTAARVLRVYLEWHGEGTITVSLSDKSYPDQILPIPTPPTTAFTSTPIVYEVKYRSASPAGRLNVLVLKTRDDGGAAVTLHAATLQ